MLVLPRGLVLTPLHQAGQPGRIYWPVNRPGQSKHQRQLISPDTHASQTLSGSVDQGASNMIETLPSEDSSGNIASAAVSIKRKASLLSLAGDALCAAMTALRLSPPTVAAEREVTLDQVSWHDHANDCWIIVYDRVYDVTRFLHKHPGGEVILLEYAGRDATMAFRSIGHDATMLEALEPYFKGILPQCERIYSCPGGKLAGLL